MTRDWADREPVLEVVSAGERLPTYPVPIGRTVIGRHPGCEVVLPDPHVSRRQVAIEWSDGALRLEDLGSKNPVKLNGTPAESGPLTEGDELRFGETTIRVVAHDPETSGDKVLLVDGAITDASQLYEIDARVTVPIVAPEGSGADVERARLEAIYGLSEELVRETDTPSLLSRMAELVFGGLPASRGFVAVGDPQREVPEVVHIWRRSGDSDDPIRMSQTILDEIQLERKALLVRDVPADFGRDAERSIADLGIRSFMCAPMISGDSVAGYLYVDQLKAEDGADPTGEFTADDLRFLTGVAHVVALALDERSLRESQKRENLQLREILRRRAEIIGSSKPMVEVLDKVTRVAERDTSVFIVGETGTGKELIARAVHDRSARSAQPFVAFNCALSSPSLIESELFGHVKGAFTDAGRDHKGKFQLADGGTLFLDEIGDMPLDTQVKLLRVLQERKVWPVGGEEAMSIDIRLIAATHRDLDQLRKDHLFRDDLYYRVAVLSLELPPLRDRGSDILELASSMLPEGASIDPPAAKALLAYPWPGNVRELQNVMEQVCFNARGPKIRLQDLPPEIAKEGRRSRVEVPLASLAEVEAKHIRKVLRAVDHNKKRAAEILGISRETLYQKIRGYGIEG